jgi:hypothetical protein
VRNFFKKPMHIEAFKPMISQCLGNMIGQRLTLRTLSLLTSRSLKEEGKRREERASLRSPI